MSKYYDDEHRPIRCRFCESTNITSKTTGYIEGYACEAEYRCGDCGEKVGYWAYGYFDPYADPDYDPSLEINDDPWLDNNEKSGQDFSSVF